MVGMVELDPSQDGDGRADEAVSVGRGDDQPPVRPAQALQAVQERAGLVDVLDHVARHHPVRRFKAESGNRIGVTAIDRMGFVTSANGVRHPGLIDVDSHKRRSDCG